VPLNEAGARYLASDLRAPYDSPVFDNSAVDGFAVRAQDIERATQQDPVTLTIAGTVFACRSDEPTKLQPGETVRTMTGAPIPSGADAMVMQEDVVASGENATFTAPASVGQAVRRRGEEYRSGDLLVPAGTLCTPGVLALVASQGLASVTVGKLPRVGVLTTGSELVQPGGTLAPGQIYESNSVALAAAVHRLTGQRPIVKTVGDDPREVRTALESLLDSCDLVVSTGGASVGEKDLVRDAAGARGVVEKFWRIAMKPGKPVAFGTHPNGALFFALPGNPVSAQVTFALLVAPVVRKMMGASDPVDKLELAYLSKRLSRVPGRKEFVRAVSRYEAGKLTVEPLAGQGSHMARGAALADRLIVVEPDVECLEAGTIVETVRWQ
jgi:molybdopterin molybdotransferase